jgi:methionine sulfoxide reductase heme-binding subunit
LNSTIREGDNTRMNGNCEPKAVLHTALQDADATRWDPRLARPLPGVRREAPPSWLFGVIEKLFPARAFVLAAVVSPGLWMAWPLFIAPDASVLADPPKYVLHHLGFTAAVLLAIVLTLSPLRVAFPRSRAIAALQRHRRFIGVSTFVYAALHVTMHFIYEGGFATFASDWNKPFILMGVIAFTILTVLAATSFNAAVRWLGARRWKWMHRLIYLAAALVVYHQISARKVFPMQVVWIFGPVFVLELWRIARTRRSQVSGARSQASVTPGSTPASAKRA